MTTLTQYTPWCLCHVKQQSHHNHYNYVECPRQSAANPRAPYLMNPSMANIHGWGTRAFLRDKTRASVECIQLENPTLAYNPAPTFASQWCRLYRQYRYVFSS